MNAPLIPRLSVCWLLHLMLGMLLAAPLTAFAQEQGQAAGEESTEVEIPAELQEALRAEIEQRQKRLASI
ncbi:MAG TPA: hypothetical protein VHC19_07515, partial [Pirellulales bacterium]|nr:hypothetical protein [Pirellulales bacterium]